MLRLLTLTLLIALLAATPLMAQDDTGDTFSESSADNFFGIGGRAVGMSEAVTASVLDGTALLYNPAGLVRLARPEFYGALSHEKVRCVSDWQSSSTSDDFAKTRLNTLSLAVPVPTYRGSFVVAFGINRVKSFDHAYTFSVGTPSTFTETGQEQSMGGIREWSAGAAIELSPRLAVGATATYYRGSEDYSWYYESAGDFNVLRYEDEISSDYSGVGIRLGMTAEVNPYLSLGLTIDSPVRYSIDQEYTQVTVENGVREEYYGTYEYTLQHPFTFNAGVAFRLETLTVEGDIGYTDWSQLEYKSEPKKPSNKALQKYYTDALQIRLGAEYVLPRYGLVLRGGFKHDPLPISGTAISNQIEKDRNSFSAGLGFLIDKMVMLDVAYARAGYEIYDGNRNMTSKFTSDKVLVSVGYRI